MFLSKIFACYPISALLKRFTQVVLLSCVGYLNATSVYAQALTTLVDFDVANGFIPFGNLIQGSDGNFYGTTSSGGTSTACASGCGTVFKVTSSGVLTTLVNFSGTNGKNPYAGVIQGTDGNIYGTTFGGGTSNLGTVFKLTPNGTLTTLINFNRANGSSPLAGLVEGNDGLLYGSTGYGGTSTACSSGCGTLFSLTPKGVLKTLVTFNYANGYYPAAALMQGSDGLLYGSTGYGGNSTVCPSGCGTLFKLTPKGSLSTLVHFNKTNGQFPRAGLSQGTDGHMYGTTYSGGNAEFGTVFKITSTGTLTTLVNFNKVNGGYPFASLIQTKDGNYYSTTYTGGSSTGCGIDLVGSPYGCGTIFRLTASGVLTTLVNFDKTHGSSPNGLVQGTDGNFYGTTYLGGVATACYGGCGTIFKFLAEPKVTDFSPKSGPAGTVVVIRGEFLSEALAVRFNGVKATKFSVDSPTQITAVVPAGATTGVVRVITPAGRDKDNVDFTVIPD